MQLQCLGRNTIRKSMEWTDMNRYYLSSPSCEICEQLQKRYVLVQPCSMYMFFIRKLWKTKQNFNWISLNNFQRLFTLPDHHTSGDATATLQPHIWWCTWKEEHPATLCKGCTSYGNRSEITWGCGNVWKAFMFFWELWKLSQIQNY
jgi:hypothetical protein